MLQSVIGVLAKVPKGIPGTEAITGVIMESETVNIKVEIKLRCIYKKQNKW
jgi:hypothetical protein